MATAPTFLSSSPPFTNFSPSKPKRIPAIVSLPLHLHHHLAAPTFVSSQSGTRGGFEAADDEPFFDGYDVVAGEDDESYDEDEEEEEEEDETESSVDLLVRFLQSMFRKVSKRAKKASRSVLPVAISPQLVSFAVDGILLLASLSIIKAFLEVICTLGGTVFAVILLLRLIWATVSYFQSSGSSFGAPQPMT